MKVTSMEISNKEFKKAIRGYNEDEVDEFLDKIAEDYENIFKENSALKEKVFVLNEKLEHYSKIESTIQNTLVLAQTAADQSKTNAQKEADIILRSANDTAQKIIDKANNDVVQINDDYEKLKQEFIKFRSKYRNFINTQLDIFNGLENELMKNYNIGQIHENKVDESELEDEGNMDNEFKIKEVNEEQIKESSLDEIKSFFVKE